ncbi:MAG: hypothetical protein HZA07_08210 [Nitrospirae bacterium]|nr:hypothetical protein [Nitrospirota bacterium]
MTFRCKNMDGCPMYKYLTSSIRILQLYPLVEEYCQNPEKYKECARYKLMMEGEVSPDNLLPNGTRLKN